MGAHSYKGAEIQCQKGTAVSEMRMRESTSVQLFGGNGETEVRC